MIDFQRPKGYAPGFRPAEFQAGEPERLGLRVVRVCANMTRAQEVAATFNWHERHQTLPKVG